MVPSTWLSIVFFLLLIAPGLLFDLLAERRRAGAEESAFREASRVALGSMVFSGVALGVLSLVRAARPEWMPDPGRLLADQQQYLADEYRLVLRALVIQVLIALLLAWWTHLAIAKVTGAPIRQRSAWAAVFRHDLPAGTQAHARVRLTDGTTYLGHVAHFNADLKRADRELVLAPPLYAATKGNKLGDVPAEWTRVVVSADQIAALSVQYRPKQKKARPRTKRWWQKDQDHAPRQEGSSSDEPGASKAG